MISHLLLAIAPIFLLILLGHVLRRGGIPSIDFWNLNDKLVYWVLFPALLFRNIATLELSGDALGRLAVVIYSGFGAAVLFSVLIRRIVAMDAPIWTSFLQGSARHNSFVALAIAESAFGQEMLATATLIAALLIPMTNVTVVTLMVTSLAQRAGGSAVLAVLRDLARNPLLLAVAAGFAFNLSGLDDVPVLFDMAEILGNAALPIVLLCVGANIRIRAMVVAALPTLLSIAGKMIVFPLAVAVAGFAVGLETPLLMAALLFGAAPTAANAYTLARAMGGDAPAMAAIVTIQTGLAFITLPLTLLLADYLLSL